MRPEDYVGYWINRVSRLLVRQTDSRLRPLGLAMSYLPVLRTLASGVKVSQKDLATAAIVEQPSMAQTLARMERDGLVESELDSDDRRVSLYSATRKSRASFPKAVEALAEAEQAALAGLSPEQRNVLRNLLQQVARNLEGSSQVVAESSPGMAPRPVGFSTQVGTAGSVSRASPAKKS